MIWVHQREGGLGRPPPPTNPIPCWLLTGQVGSVVAGIAKSKAAYPFVFIIFDIEECMD